MQARISLILYQACVFQRSHVGRYSQRSYRQFRARRSPPHFDAANSLRVTVQRRGWNFVEKAQKAAVKDIVAVLQPPLLKMPIEDALRLEKNELKDDFFGFLDSLADKLKCVNASSRFVTTRKQIRKSRRRTIPKMFQVSLPPQTTGTIISARMVHSPRKTKTRKARKT